MGYCCLPMGVLRGARFLALAGRLCPCEYKYITHRISTLRSIGSIFISLSRSFRYQKPLPKQTSPKPPTATSPPLLTPLPPNLSHPQPQPSTHEHSHPAQRPLSSVLCGPITTLVRISPAQNGKGGEDETCTISQPQLSHIPRRTSTRPNSSFEFSTAP